MRVKVRGREREKAKVQRDRESSEGGRERERQRPNKVSFHALCSHWSITIFNHINFYNHRELLVNKIYMLVELVFFPIYDRHTREKTELRFLLKSC